MLNKCQLINEDDMVTYFPHVTPTPPNTVSRDQVQKWKQEYFKALLYRLINVNPPTFKFKSILFLIKYKLLHMFNALFMYLFKPLPSSHVFFYSSLSWVVLRGIFHAPMRCLHVYFVSVLALRSSFQGSQTLKGCYLKGTLRPFQMKGEGYFFN